MVRLTSSFKRGRAGEDAVRLFLKTEGYFCVPTGMIDNGGAPRLEAELRSLVIPDLQAFKDGVPEWVEVKVKARASFNRNRNRWEHCIEWRLCRDYMGVAKATGMQGSLAILQQDDRRLLIGTFDTLMLHGIVEHGPFPAGHAFHEPMVFFDCNDFTEYRPDGDFWKLVPEAPEPNVIRSWERRPHDGGAK